MQGTLLLAIAAAGSLGAVSRYLLTLGVHALCPQFPLHTFVVNVLGCLLFGVCWAAGNERWSPVLSNAVLVGFFGAFTTFSSFAFDCLALYEQQRLWSLLANVVGQNVLGLLAMLAGIALGDVMTAR